MKRRVRLTDLDQIGTLDELDDKIDCARLGVDRWKVPRRGA